MIDINKIREDKDGVIKKLSKRGGSFKCVAELVLIDKKRREMIQKLDELKNKKNILSKEIGKQKAKGEDISSILKKVENIKKESKDEEAKLVEIEKQFKKIIEIIPNIPDDRVPIGNSEEDNIEIKKTGKIKRFDFEPKRHFELGEKLGVLDFKRAAKMTGSRFVSYKGLGARMERALINFMIETQEKKGYTELIPPYIVNEESLFSTGHLPKFKEDLFKLENRKWYLNPTAEASIGMHRDEMIKGKELPIRYVAYTMAFRSEAGSAGRDTRGIMRTHQFNKVELLVLSKPEKSNEQLEKMLLDSESILKELEIPYRVVVLCGGDLGFGATITYDIEMWLPGENRYAEVASISNVEDFQARRGNIRYKENSESVPKFVHTLNGSSLAVGRTLLAIFENYQTKEGTIKVPKVLQKYMGGVKEIK